MNFGDLKIESNSVPSLDLWECVDSLTLSEVMGDLLMVLRSKDYKRNEYSHIVRSIVNWAFMDLHPVTEKQLRVLKLHLLYNEHLLGV